MSANLYIRTYDEDGFRFKKFLGESDEVVVIGGVHYSTYHILNEMTEFDYQMLALKYFKDLVNVWKCSVCGLEWDSYAGANDCSKSSHEYHDGSKHKRKN